MGPPCSPALLTSVAPSCFGASRPECAPKLLLAILSWCWQQNFHQMGHQCSRALRTAPPSFGASRLGRAPKLLLVILGSWRQQNFLQLGLTIQPRQTLRLTLLLSGPRQTLQFGRRQQALRFGAM